MQGTERAQTKETDSVWGTVYHQAVCGRIDGSSPGKKEGKDVLGQGNSKGKGMVCLEKGSVFGIPAV